MVTSTDGTVRLGVVRGVSYGLFGPPDLFVPQARALGAGFVRAYVYWSQVEPTPGVHDWRVVDALLDQLEPGVDVWLTLCSSSPWATVVPTDFQPPSPALDDDAYARFVHEVVTRCGGRVRYWQCNNEPSNAGLLWAGSAQDYVHQLRIMAREVRAVDPKASVVLGGCGYDMLSSPVDSPERAFFDVLAREGRESFDLFSVHLYDDPYRIPGHVETARALMHRHGYIKPIVVGEYNGPTLFDFPAATAALEAAMSAAFAASDSAQDGTVLMSTHELAEQIASDSPDRRALRRLYAQREELPLELQLFMADAPAHLQQLRDRIARRQLIQRALLALAAGVHTLACWQLAPEVGNYTDPLNIMDLMFGRLPLMDFAGDAITTLRPVAHTHRLLASFLAGAQSVQQFDDSEPDVYAFQVQLPNGRIRLAAWLRNDDVLQEAATSRIHLLPWTCRTVHGTDVFGRAHPVRLTDGQAQIELTPTPVLISPDPLVPVAPMDIAR